MLHRSNAGREGVSLDTFNKKKTLILGYVKCTSFDKCIQIFNYFHQIIFVEKVV